ncbi:type I-E CRISPR-associated protein Cse2/CasB [Nocardia farcinica]|nr:type I-E CRISPR-associated protein Cse2/CasB [Nocardia farcinica]MBF6189038.1 type I-E CRISPR-associated protein Cse2/CasB [Nocardia farcinica]MBF6266005.1 type I-E CRISPR-associated protein Cse2/CasB [Nocardia farcinica]MBF6284547.1 type I-E CRISPR-associated protein Cse2/CasB [Nocardia farcinica]MBF6309005.1 type I-E CRISPR-associated protein Cse2/CasB [Nocardia farcinica]MBF6393001.1 type I-E CRISPR-associated protein Cse2/CasB [Nocardia farcinica]
MAQRYWSRFIDEDGSWNSPDNRPPGEDLAALRAGLGREALTVPKMWPFYTVGPDPDGERYGTASIAQEAEHAALALYGLHQQSQTEPMHRPGVGVGTALLNLRRKDPDNVKPVDRRVSALVTSTSLTALLNRMRGLVTQLREAEQPLDYDQLVRDLHAWPRPDGRRRVRKSWAQGYQRWTDKTEPDAAGDAPDNRISKES